MSFLAVVSSDSSLIGTPNSTQKDGWKDGWIEGGKDCLGLPIFQSSCLPILGANESILRPFYHYEKIFKFGDSQHT